MNRFRLTALAGLFWVLAISVAAAQKPVVTIAFSGYKELKADVSYLGNLGGNPALADGLEALLQMITQNQALAAIDPAKPWGVVIQSSENEFPIAAFVPSKDPKKAFDMLQQRGVPITKNGDVYEVDTPLRRLYMQGKVGYILIADKREGLAKFPTDPVSLVGALAKDYDLAVKFNVANLPDPFREMVVAQMQSAMQSSMRPGPDESEDQFAARTAQVQQATEQFKRLLNELNELTIGLKIDSQKNIGLVDVDLSAKPGTQTAEAFKSLKSTKSSFTGMLLSAAAVTFNGAGQMSDAEVTRAKANLQSLRQTAEQELSKQEMKEEDLKTARDIIADGFKILEESVELKRSDIGLSVVMNHDQLTFVGGGLIADGEKIEQFAKKVVDALAKDQPEMAAKVKLNVSSSNGVRFHTVSIPLPEKAESLSKMIGGNELQIVVGTAKQALYVAGGKDAMETVQQAIAKTQATGSVSIPPGKLVVAGLPIAQFVAEVSTEDSVKQGATMVADMLQQSKGKDKITATSTAQPNGGRLRIEFEEGWLRLLGFGMQGAFSGNFAPPQP